MLSSNSRDVELLNTINGSSGWLSHETTGFEGLGWSETSIMGFQGSTFEYCPDDKTYAVPETWYRSPWIPTKTRSPKNQKSNKKSNPKSHFKPKRITSLLVEIEFSGQVGNAYTELRYFKSDSDVATSTFPVWSTHAWYLLDKLNIYDESGLDRKFQRFNLTDIDDTDGVYIAVRTGEMSCIAISPIRVYYRVCEETVTNLIRFSESPSSYYHQVNGECVANSGLVKNGRLISSRGGISNIQSKGK